MNYNQNTAVSYTSSSGSTGYIAIGSERPTPHFAHALELQQKAVAYGHELAARISQAIDRLAGSEPAAVAVGNKVGSAPRPAGLLSGFQDCQEGIEDLNRRLTELADRLDRIA